jgi:hypothetical protein
MPNGMTWESGILFEVFWDIFTFAFSAVVAASPGLVWLSLGGETIVTSMRAPVRGGAGRVPRHRRT